MIAAALLVIAQLSVERLIDQGRLEEARAALSSVEDGRRLALLEAMILFRESKPAAALARLRPQLETGDAAPDSYKLAALCLVAMNRPREAGTYLQEAVRRKPEDAMAHYYLGMHRLQERQYADAAASLRQAVRLNPEYPDSYTMLGLALEESGDDEGALANYQVGAERTEKLGVPKESAYIYLARFYQGRNRNQEVLSAANKALAINPRNAEAWLLKGKALLETGDYDAAIRALDRGVELAPKDKRLRYQRMRAFQRSGRTEEARRERETYQKMTGEELDRWENSVLKEPKP